MLCTTFGLLREAVFLLRFDLQKDELIGTSNGVRLMFRAMLLQILVSTA